MFQLYRKRRVENEGPSSKDRKKLGMTGTLFMGYNEMRMERDQKIHINDGGKGTEIRRCK